MTIDERILKVFHAADDTEAADVDFLCDQLSLPRDGTHRPAIESFRRQIWHVAAEMAAEAFQ